MRMSAETMKRNGDVLSTAHQLLVEAGVATIEMIALVSGYSETNVRKALSSLEKQEALAVTADAVTEVHGFKPA